MKFFVSLFVALLSINAFADITKALPVNDPLAKVAKAIRTQLRDGNISNGGSTELSAGKLKSSPNDFEALVLEGFEQAFKEDQGESLPEGTEIKVSVGKFRDGDGKNGSVAKMTVGILESNDYTSDNEELTASQARYLWVVLRKMPVSSDTLIGSVTVTIKNQIGDDATVRYFLLVNKDKKAVQLFTIQGRM